MPSQVYRGALQSVYDLPARVTTSSQNPPPQKNLRVGNIFYGYELFPAIFLIPDMNNVIPELMPDLRQSSMGSCCVGTVPLAETAKSDRFAASLGCLRSQARAGYHGGGPRHLFFHTWPSPLSVVEKVCRPPIASWILFTDYYWLTMTRIY